MVVETPTALKGTLDDALEGATQGGKVLAKKGQNRDMKMIGSVARHLMVS
jgi:hypothetical protein